MSDSVIPTSSKTEWKVKAASLAVFVATTAGIAFLQEAAPDFVKDLPVWLQAPAGALILAAVAWLTGRQASSKPGALSPSTLAAAKSYLRRDARG